MQGTRTMLSLQICLWRGRQITITLKLNAQWEEKLFPSDLKKLWKYLDTTIVICNVLTFSALQTARICGHLHWLFYLQIYKMTCGHQTLHQRDKGLRVHWHSKSTPLPLHIFLSILIWSTVSAHHKATITSVNFLVRHPLCTRAMVTHCLECGIPVWLAHS